MNHRFISLLLIVSWYNCYINGITVILPEPIQLTTAKVLDGSLVTWHTLVEMIHPLMQLLHEKLFSKDVQHGYLYAGEVYSLAQLKYLEDNGVNDQEFLDLIVQVKRDFLHIGKSLFNDIVKIKPLIVRIIKESCTSRKKEHSFLWKWAEVSVGKEEKIFVKSIHTMNDLYDFCFDFLVGLHDFVHSCSRARAQLHLQLEKWHKLKNIVQYFIEEQILTLTKNEQEYFLQNVKNNGLVSISIEELTHDWVLDRYYALYESSK